MSQPGRPREFVVDEVLDKAMQAFWSRGYEATSLVNLIDATGLQKGSLYKAFGDKHNLFMQALDRYLSQGYADFRRTIADADSARAGLSAWLASVLGLCDGHNEGRGCFAVNSVVELASHDAEVGERLEKHFKKMRRALERTIAEGQANGELRADESAANLADFLLVFVMGIVTDSKRSAAPSKTSRHLVDLALRTLE